jgi:endogenous inhibitor of DNA gyrase (YacG/DUF329 family)
MSKIPLCPICHKALWAPDRQDHPRSRYFPFCSERCKLIDLGAWFDGNYRIGSPTGPEGGPTSGEDPE